LARLGKAGKPLAVVPVWTVFDFDIAEDGLAKRASALSEQLSRVQQGPSVRGLLLQPALASHTNASDIAETTHCLAARLRLPVQAGLDDFELLLQEALL